MVKVVLITGASSGIGRKTALRLIREGYIVYGAARRAAEMKVLADAGGHVLTMDITREEDIADAVNQIVREQGKIDILINNAGYAIYGSVEETSLEDARRQFDVNLFGLARLTQLVLPHFRKQGSGIIMNISSMGGKIYTPLGAWYHASKHALEGWSDCLRLETKPFGIKVIIIEPGIIATEFNDVYTRPMIERSGKGPYANLAKSVEKATLEYGKPGASSPADLIAGVIAGAIRDEHPKTRYRAGKMAKLMISIRKFFGDRVFDRAVMSQVR